MLMWEINFHNESEICLQITPLIVTESDRLTCTLGVVPHCVKGGFFQLSSMFSSGFQA